MTYKPYPKRDPIKNYFPLPNEVFALGLTTGEIAVYSYLMRCEDRKTHRCHPSYDTIGRAVNLSKNTVRKHVQGLCEKGLITVEPTTVITKRGEKRNGTLLYTLRPVEEAVRLHVGQRIRNAEEERARRQTQEKLDALAMERRAGSTPGKSADAPPETHP